MQAGKDWKQIQEEGDEDEPESRDENWEDWLDEGEDASVCLFCAHTAPTADRCLAHARDVHSFDLRKLIEDWSASPIFLAVIH